MIEKINGQKKRHSWPGHYFVTEESSKVDNFTIHYNSLHNKGCVNCLSLSCRKCRLIRRVDVCSCVVFRAAHWNVVLELITTWTCCLCRIISSPLVFVSSSPPTRIFTVNQSKHDRISSDMTCKENEWGLIELLTSRLSTMGFFLSVLVQSTSAWQEA